MSSAFATKTNCSMSRQWMVSLPARKPHRVRQASDRDQIDPLLERLSYWHERSPLVGTEGVDARPNSFAALALPAPVGVFLRFTQPRHQTRAADSERISAALRPEAAEQMKGRVFCAGQRVPRPSGGRRDSAACDSSASIISGLR